MSLIIPFSSDGVGRLELPLACLNWPDFPYAPEVAVALFHDGRAVHIRFDVQEAHLRALETVDNRPVCVDSCVEAFVLDADGEHYFNFECNPLGTLLAARRRTRPDKTPLSPAELTGVGRCGSHVSPVRLPLDVRAEDGASCRWWLEMEIPFTLLGYRELPRTLRMNLYKCGDNTDRRHYLSLFPIPSEKPGFHRPDCFGVFEIEQIMNI